jgi:hypothetical protein
MDRYLFLLGFSPFTGEYKLFRISFRQRGEGHYVDVYTLGDSRRWRKLPLLVPLRQIHGVPPVLVDGKLYVLTGRYQFAGKPEGILVVDVASETHCTYSLPVQYVDPGSDALVDAFELHGWLCLAVNYVLVSPDRPRVEFWVMPRLGELDSKNHGQLNWKLRYTFYVDVDHGRRKAATSSYVWGRQYYRDQPKAAWLDEDELLCYIVGNCLYKYNTRSAYSRPDPDGNFLAWHHKVQLPTTPSPSNRQLNIYGGYRPSLLSPLAFALPPSQEDEDNLQYEHAMLAKCSPAPYVNKNATPSNDRINCL